MDMLFCTEKLTLGKYGIVIAIPLRNLESNKTIISV